MNRRCFHAYTFVLAAVLVIAGTTGASAQRFVDVPAGYNTLQTTLSADSANRVANPNTIYRLHRGVDSFYVMTKTLTAWGSMTLQIQSAGTGPLPHFMWVTQSDGTAPSPLISVTETCR